MKRAERACRGQALLEFAILGSLALLALTFLIQMGLRMNYQQQVQQDAFRNALTVAQSEGDEESQAVQYNLFRNRRTPNPSEGFAVTPRVLTQGNATVTWGEWLTFLESGDRESQPRIMVNLDDQSVLDARAEDFPADQPLVRRIQKDLTGTATITQTGAGSSLASNTSESTSMELSSGDTVSSTVNTPVNYTW